MEKNKKEVMTKHAKSHHTHSREAPFKPKETVVIKKIEKTIKFKLIPLTKRDKKELISLLEDYTKMLKESLEIIMKHNIVSKRKAHEKCYKHLREKYPHLHNKFVQEAYKRALTMYNSYRQRLKKWRRGKLKHKPSPPELKAKNVLDLHIDTFRIAERGGYKLLRLSYSSGQYIWFLIMEYGWASKHLSSGLGS